METKNGESYDGILTGADTYMNLRLRDVVVTAADGLTFCKHPVAFIRGNNIKSIQMPGDILERHVQELKKKEAEAKAMKSGGSDRGRSHSASGRGFFHDRGHSRGGFGRGSGDRNKSQDSRGRGRGRGGDSYFRGRGQRGGK